ncbi:TetR/AcrR family transcriptional regulator [Cupriavidus consociatus]|uniref:TetR/AcrR family transcriptional regulator n=1 Tax=Cupriavidus consociatus TaxID=2821357 RepID=UPI001AE55C25|nr:MULTISPECIES: TetR/AcrR family transcriptional regulator [unclassified Cupriavidus]MBP0621188.1 TetR/AcrR family transcriptional regulator [Cupriavidus sp. LEh25]MDK2657859.1 TetR/AcrR family transcriptional regulator [Cupriavidus sp. LEh21]
MPEKGKTEVVRRKAALSAFRRELIRDAAKRVFVEVGLPGASVREIAKAAGCTTGAIYAQYTNKEEVYADILRESLSDMAEAVEGGAKAGPPGRQAEAALRAWYVYFRDRPAEFDLGFYLYGGAQPAGVGKELNRELNVRLKRVYAAVAEAMEADGIAGPEVKHELAVAGASWIFGILLMLKTGRLKILSVNVENILEECFQAIYRKK